MASILIVKWVVKASEVARIRELLPDLADRTRAETGNLFYAIYQSVTDPNVFILHEVYADADAAAAHRNSDHYQSIVAKQIAPHLEVREVNSVAQLL